MELIKEYLYPWIGSNLIAIILVWLAIRKPRIARGAFALLFGWACWINFTTAHANPVEYINYASLTPFDSYRNFSRVGLLKILQ